MVNKIWSSGFKIGPSDLVYCTKAKFVRPVFLFIMSSGFGLLYQLVNLSLLFPAMTSLLVLKTFWQQRWQCHQMWQVPILEAFGDNFLPRIASNFATFGDFRKAKIFILDHIKQFIVTLDVYILALNLPLV